MALIKTREGKRVYGENVSANNTVVAADSGSVLNQIVDNLVTTLPNLTTSMVGLEVIVQLGGVPAGGPVGSGSNASLSHEIAPHASDKIVGAGIAGVVDKSLLMSDANMVVGDYVRLRGDGVDTWYVVEMSGAWTIEA